MARRMEFLVLGDGEGLILPPIRSCAPTQEARALPLSRAALDRCVGEQLNGARFSHVARAVRLVPGKSLRKRLRREACLRA